MHKSLQSQSIVLPSVLFSLLLAACAAFPPAITISEAWVRPTAQGNNAAVYLVIKNGTPADLIILAASTKVARAVEIHQSMILSADDLDGMIEGGAVEATNEMQMQDVMQMTPLNAVELPSGSSLSFEPGGLHIMLIDLENELTLGGNLLLTLSFDNREDLQFEVLVDER